MAGMVNRDRLLVSVEYGGSYAPCSYLYRIEHEGIHRACMAQVAERGGPEPEDQEGRDDNVLLSEDSAYEITPRRYHGDLGGGWSVRFFVDAWEACSYYGYDCGACIDYATIIDRGKVAR